MTSPHEIVGAWIVSTLKKSEPHLDEEAVKVAKAMDDILADHDWDEAGRRNRERNKQLRLDARMTNARAARGANSKVKPRRAAIAELKRKRPSLSVGEIAEALADQHMAASPSTIYNDLRVLGLSPALNRK